MATDLTSPRRFGPRRTAIEYELWVWTDKRRDMARVHVIAPNLKAAKAEVRDDVGPFHLHSWCKTAVQP